MVPDTFFALAVLAAIGPFAKEQSVRDDAVAGTIELSDGSMHRGMIFLTRDKRLQIYDEQLQRQREVPLQAAAKIDCAVKWERLEKEWKFKETTSDEKLYTGRTYPAREYVHTLTLKNGEKITGPVSAIIYLQPKQGGDARKFLLNKRNKGTPGQDLKSLVYVKTIKFGKDDL